MQKTQNLNMLDSCDLCPRHCRCDRIAGETGVCGETAIIRLARASLHLWEEPPISGEQGSGTVFFSGCPLNCVYCQNAQIASGEIGRSVTTERLAHIFLEQQGRGAHNINLVTPTHFAPQIADALEIARDKGLALPIVYNTSGYDSVETLRALRGKIDIYLTDFKYASSAIARRYSHAADYPQVALQALDEMYAQVGEYSCDEQDILRHGIIVRHLLLPGHIEDSKAVIDILVERPYISKICVSLMNQYTPLGELEGFPELKRQVSEDEYDELIDYALDKGIENSFMQEGGTAEESFIPDFDYSGV